jgi:hypothetical protein
MIKTAAQSSLLNDPRYTSMSAGVVPSREYLISTALIVENTPIVTFDVSSFAGIYKHLQICYIARSTRANDGDNLGVRFNGVTTSSYSHHRLFANVGTVSVFGSANANTMLGDAVPSSTSAANSFAGGIIDILDPYSTVKNKTMRVFSGYAQSNGVVELVSGAFYSTNPLTSIEIVALTGNLVAGSRFSLYGVTA